MFHVGAIVTDFRKSSIGMRDRLYLEKDRLDKFIKSIPEDAPLKELVIVCTCNRIEIYYACDNHDIAFIWLTRYLADFHGITLSCLSETVEVYHCEEAVRHLFRVASGIESMVFGEHEILGQIRDSYFVCFYKHCTNSYLNKLFQQAIATGKQVRCDTAIGTGSCSVVSVAIKQMKELAGDFKNKNIMIVGLGVMGFRTLKLIVNLNFNKIGLCNRTDERALRLCTHFNSEFIPFCNLHNNLNDYDIIILATSSEQHILKCTDFVHRNLAEKPLIIIDLGAPRNADPCLGSLDNVTLVCIDDLRMTADNILKNRKNELEHVESIVEQQVQEFKRWYFYKSRCSCGQK